MSEMRRIPPRARAWMPSALERTPTVRDESAIFAFAGERDLDALPVDVGFCAKNRRLQLVSAPPCRAKFWPVTFGCCSPPIVSLTSSPGGGSGLRCAQPRIVMIPRLRETAAPRRI